MRATKKEKMGNYVCKVGKYDIRHIIKSGGTSKRTFGNAKKTKGCMIVTPSRLCIEITPSHRKTKSTAHINRKFSGCNNKADKKIYIDSFSWRICQRRPKIRDSSDFDYAKSTLIKIQKQLMVVASQLAIESQNDFPENLVPIQRDEVRFLEQEIDLLTERLLPLKNFVIPGGHMLVSYTHLARSVCRRTERYITELDHQESLSPCIIAYSC